MTALLTQLFGLILMGFRIWIADPDRDRLVGISNSEWAICVLAGFAVLIVGLIARADERMADRDR